ncbi:MAG TPA: histidine phosphatase family protein [Pseudonocardiaceae bacterium]|nr:histidine phosphatase family protein [Pseudonocardiaceae bacterium]
MAGIVKSWPRNLTATQSYMLIRHAETRTNSRARWHGESDEQISPHGATQAAAAARRLARMAEQPSLIVSSRLRRAIETAEIFAEELSITQIHHDESLGERDMGDWKGLAPHEVESEWPGLLSEWEAGHIQGPPNGEPDSVVTERALAALTRFAGFASKPILVVTHGGVIRSLRKAAGLTNHPVPHLGGYWAHIGCVDGEWSLDGQIVLGDTNDRPRT